MLLSRDGGLQPHLRLSLRLRLKGHEQNTPHNTA